MVCGYELADMPVRILIVDDEKLIADTLTVILTRSGYECRTAYDGEEALALAQWFDPHLVISDVIMPKMGGLDLYRALTGLPNRPIVMLISGNAKLLGIVEKEKTLGRRLELLAKPIPLRELLDQVSKLTSEFSVN
jgi:DNA-binding response OmpR family regulator